MSLERFSLGAFLRVGLGIYSPVGWLEYRQYSFAGDSPTALLSTGQLSAPAGSQARRYCTVGI